MYQLQLLSLTDFRGDVHKHNRYIYVYTQTLTCIGSKHTHTHISGHINTAMTLWGFAVLAKLSSAECVSVILCATNTHTHTLPPPNTHVWYPVRTKASHTIADSLWLQFRRTACKSPNQGTELTKCQQEVLTSSDGGLTSVVDTRGR